MREHVRPANLVTTLSLLLGFLALLAVPHRAVLAVPLVLLAAVLDVVDGALARRKGGDHTFGGQLDSLADLLCFCVVPAYALSLGAGVPGAVAACTVVVAGAWRLARFPLVQQEGHFVGLPTPAAGGLVLLLALWVPDAVAVLGALGLGWLMVSSVRFPTVLAAAASARPGRRAHALRSRLIRPAGLSRVLRRAPRTALRRPGPRVRGRAGRALRRLRREGRRRS